MAVECERRGRVLIISMRREEKRNAVDPAMTAGLDAGLNELEDDPELWVGILTGTRTVFSAGTDLKLGSGPETERGGPYGVIRRARSKPLIAAVEGFALGGGMEMVLACDLVVASRTASFGLPEVKRGLFPLYGGVFRSAQALPLNVARELILTGDPIGADRAHMCGLVNILTEPGAALEGALRLAERICTNSPVAVRESRRALEQVVTSNDPLAWQATEEAVGVVHASEDSKEGWLAFFERRPPRWTGR